MICLDQTSTRLVRTECTREVSPLAEKRTKQNRNTENNTARLTADASTPLVNKQRGLGRGVVCAGATTPHAHNAPRVNEHVNIGV